MEKQYAKQYEKNTKKSTKIYKFGNKLYATLSEKQDGAPKTKILL